jgi:HK97 gp10 family phage protein
MADQPVTIEGMDTLVEKMKALGMVTADLKDDAVSAMSMVRNAARRKAPTDETVLQKNIVVKDMTSGKDLQVGCGIFAESAVNYAVYQEYGTGIYAENGQGRKTPWRFVVQSAKWANIWGINVGDLSPPFYGNHPHPFMRPAWDEEKENVQKYLKDAIIKKLEVLKV